MKPMGDTAVKRRAIIFDEEMSLGRIRWTSQYIGEFSVRCIVG